LIFADSRSMLEIEDSNVDLVVTSPPYWHIKDYGVADQIGYGQNLHDYLVDLYRVWLECFRVLKPGCRLCINIGDQFARSVTYGRYKVIPLHAEIISQCERIGLDFMGSIIWQKKTTMNTTGGATVMGSFPYPASGVVEIDYEYIHIFKVPGKSGRVAKQIKEASRLTKQEWKEYFRGHWQFGGARKIGHEAMFPAELPRRLIRMFSFVGDTVLDPFVGSGTTLKAGIDLGRNVIGYEVNPEFAGVIKAKLGLEAAKHPAIEVNERARKVKLSPVDYLPGIQNARAGTYGKPGRARDDLHRVTNILDEQTLEVNGGLRIRLLGIRIVDKRGALGYLRHRVLGKDVVVKPDQGAGEAAGDARDAGEVAAYVYLKNRIFVNTHLIKAGLAHPDRSAKHRLKARFEALKKTDAS
jgi:DNA modification methylase